ncbi:MAG TPA: acylphosphatase [Solirubrobacteraceae bacterium]
MSTQSGGALRRVRARVDGTVQGVGYRPFVYRLAGELGIAGWVLNDERGVLVEAEGPPDAVHVFLARLSADAPPLAEVRGVAAEDVPVVGEAVDERAVPDALDGAVDPGADAPHRPLGLRAHGAAGGGPGAASSTSSRSTW